MIEFAERPKGQNEIKAAYISGIVGCGASVQSVEGLLKGAAGEDRSVIVEACEEGVQDTLDHVAIFRKPDNVGSI